MIITIKGKIEKGAIRLPKKVCLPDGTWVIAKIEPILTTREKLKIISALSGGWDDDLTIIPIFNEIELERHHYFGRGINF